VLEQGQNHLDACQFRAHIGRRWRFFLTSAPIFLIERVQGDKKESGCSHRSGNPFHYTLLRASASSFSLLPDSTSLSSSEEFVICLHKLWLFAVLAAGRLPACACGDNRQLIFEILPRQFRN
jgi:hypothetical protein